MLRMNAAQLQQPAELPGSSFRGLLALQVAIPDALSKPLTTALSEALTGTGVLRRADAPGDPFRKQRNIILEKLGDRGMHIEHQLRSDSKEGLRQIKYCDVGAAKLASRGCALQTKRNVKAI